MSKRSCLFFSITFILVIFASQAFAELQFTPRIKLREEYNDNIFLTNDKTYDFISTISPGLDVNYKNNNTRILLDYSFYYYYYAINTEQSQITNNILLDTFIPFKDIVFLKVTDQYTRVPLNTRGRVGIDNIFVNLTDANNLLVNPYISYPLGSSVKLNLGYTYENQWYSSSQGIDYQQHTGNVGLTKEISSKLAVNLFYNYIMFRPAIITPLNDSYDSQNINFGINYEITPKISLKGSVGKVWFDYQNSGKRDSLIWDINGNYNVSDSLTIKAMFSQNFYNAINQGLYKEEKASAAVVYQSGASLTLNAYGLIDTYEELNREDKKAGIDVMTSVLITSQLTGRLLGMYQYYDYLNGGLLESEKGNRFGTQLAFDYRINIATLTCGYTFNYNTSNIDLNDYNNNIAFVQANFKF